MSTPSHRGEPTRRAVQLDVRRNSLNLIRLLLAFSILFSHSFPLGGFGLGPRINGETSGTWAVYSFFALSGYLITASRLSNPVGTYLVKRIARIFPAFFVCNVVTAFVFAPAVRLHRGGSSSDLFTAPNSPANYVYSNLLLRMEMYDIAGGPTGVPYPGAWNGSLWSLYYEGVCYLVIGALACVAFLRGPRAMTAVFALSVAVWASAGHLVPYLDNGRFGQTIELVPIFFGGALMFMVRERVGLSWPGALVALTGLVAVVTFVDGWGIQLASPLLTYLILWLATVLPTPAIIRRHDLSFGLYLYAFPVQQLLSVGGLNQHGLVAYTALAAAIALTLALASWVLVERPAMALLRGTPVWAPRRKRAVAPADATPVATGPATA